MNVIHECEQALCIQKILTRVHKGAMLAACVKRKHEEVTLLPTLTLQISCVTPMSSVHQHIDGVL